MFESEIKEVREKLARSLIQWRKIEKLEKETNKLQDYKNSQIFYLGFRNYGKYEVYNQANNAIRKIMNEEAGFNMSFNFDNNKKSFNINCKRILKFTNEDVLTEFKKYLAPNSYDKEKIIIKGDTAEIKLGDYYLRILLNVINIFINGKIEEKEIFDKCREVLTNENTFIYRDIKITIYKNGKTKLSFKNSKAQKEMYKLFKEVQE